MNGKIFSIVTFEIPLAPDFGTDATSRSLKQMPDKKFEQLKHPNPHLRMRAMQEIAETRHENTISRLMSILDV